jgi:hypothetical protein
MYYQEVQLAISAVRATRLARISVTVRAVVYGMPRARGLRDPVLGPCASTSLTSEGLDDPNLSAQEPVCCRVQESLRTMPP